MTDSDRIKKVLGRGVEEVIELDHLTDALKSGRKLRIKFGIDPTSPDLHLGHSVVLRKLRQFQDMGHTAVLIIGDFTATIGDPTGKTEARKPLTDKEVKTNFKKYIKLAGKILSKKNLEITHNSEWFRKEGSAAMLTLASAATVQQSLHRADFQKRIESGGDLTILELIYPVFQGYDSVKVGADVELGGTDQKFNLLMGRKIQRFYKMKEQDILTVPILEGLDGVKKMSKSLGNYIALDENPDSMFGKIMSINDNLIIKYFLLCTDLAESEIDKISSEISKKKMNPRDAKVRLAKEIVGIYHDLESANMAEEEFNRVFRSKEKPTEIPIFKTDRSGMDIVAILVGSGLASSKSEASRLIEQKGVRIDGVRVTDPSIIIKKEAIVQAGKRHFVRVVI
ncbi:MAG TPA: tyrosine--tRNA ligase [Candidatus Paceibacterota bacterium]